MLCAIPIGLLYGFAAVLESEVEHKRRRFGLILLISVIASLVSSFAVSKLSDCTQMEVLLLSKYCGAHLVARFHYGLQAFVVFSLCAFLIAIFREKQHAKDAP